MHTMKMMRSAFVRFPLSILSIALAATPLLLAPSALAQEKVGEKVVEHPAAPTSLLDISISQIDSFLRDAGPRQQHSDEENQPFVRFNPLGITQRALFPYTRVENYFVTGMNVTFFDLSRNAAKIQISIPWNARTESVWPALLKTLKLPADTSRPVNSPDLKEDTIVFPGNGRNWVAFRSFANSVDLVIGDREVYATPQAMLQDQVNDAKTAEALEDTFGGLLKDQERK